MVYWVFKVQTDMNFLLAQTIDVLRLYWFYIICRPFGLYRVLKILRGTWVLHVLIILQFLQVLHVLLILQVLQTLQF